MTWWDPTTWNDVAAEGWQRDIEDAVDQAERWIETVAIAKGWLPAYTATASSLVVAVANVADDPQDFFSMLALQWAAALDDPPAGWAELGRTFTSAAGAVGTISDADELGSFTSQLGGAASGAASDVADAALWLRKWGPWIVLFLVVLFVSVYAWRLAK